MLRPEPAGSRARGTTGTPRARRRRPWVVLWSVALLLLTAGCAPEGITDKAHSVHNLYVTIVILAAPVFFGVEGWLIYNIVRYRRRGNEEPPQIFGENRRGLLGLFAIPLVIIIFLFPFGEATLMTVQRNDPNPTVNIKVEGFQWEWTFNYVDEGLTESGVTLVKPATMELPVDEPVHIDLASRDVMHEFYVQELLFMRNAFPGHRNSFSFTPTKLGTFQGQCAEFCGLNHNRMTFVLKVVPRAEYVAWVAAEKAKANSATCGLQGDGTTVTAIAHNIQWNAGCFAVKAGAPFKVTFKNDDSGIQHNFAVYQNRDAKTAYLQTPHLTGVASGTFTGKALPAGRYYFQCDVHGPSMSGAFVVK